MDKDERAEDEQEEAPKKPKVARPTPSQPKGKAKAQRPLDIGNDEAIEVCCRSADSASAAIHPSLPCRSAGVLCPLGQGVLAERDDADR